MSDFYTVVRAETRYVPTLDRWELDLYFWVFASRQDAIEAWASGRCQTVTSKGGDCVFMFQGLPLPNSELSESEQSLFHQHNLIKERPESLPVYSLSQQEALTTATPERT